MNWLFKTASAASLSFMLLGPAYALPDGTTAAATASAKGSFSGVSLTVHSMTLEGASTTFDIKSDGSYTVTTQGGIAKFIEINAQGKLSSSELTSLRNALSKVQKADPPANLPGLVPGSPGFDISWSEGGKPMSTGGATNVKAAIQDAEQNHQDVSAWKAVAPLLTKMQTLQTSLEKSYNPVKPAPADKSKFDQLTIEEQNTWNGSTTKLAVNGDGSYTLTSSLSSTPVTGTLTADQLAALNKAYDANAIQANDGKMVGGLIPDDTEFKITATQGGQTFAFNGSVDSSSLGALQSLEKALVGDVNAVQAPVAQPLAKDADGKDATPADAAMGRPARTPGMSAELQGMVQQGADKSDGKDAADAGK